jgi:hypothetical protein
MEGTGVSTGDQALAGLRRWIIALTVLGGLALLVLAALAVVAGATYYKDYIADEVTDPGPKASTAAELKHWVQDVYGDALDTVDVYQVELGYHDGSYGVPDRPYAVTYTLKGYPVPITGLVDNTSTFNDSGLAPTMVQLDDQMGLKDLKNLTVAWSKETTKPMGFSYSYTSDLASYGYASGDKIEYGGTSYTVDDLWCVNEGWVPPKSAPTWSATDLPEVRALIFKFDRTHGTFTYVGTEGSQVPVYGGSDSGGC